MDFQQKVRDPTTHDRAVVELDRTLASWLRDEDDREKWRRYILDHSSEAVVDADPKPVERMLTLFRALRQQGYLTRPTGKSAIRLINRKLTKIEVDRLRASNVPAASCVRVSASQSACVPDQAASSWIDGNLIQSPLMTCSECSRVGVGYRAKPKDGLCYCRTCWASQPGCVPDREASIWIDQNLIHRFPMTCLECRKLGLVYYAKQEERFRYCRTCWISWICSYTTQKSTSAAVLDGGRDRRRGGDHPAEVWVAETLAFAGPGCCGGCGNCEGVYVAFENQRREAGFCMPCWVEFYGAWEPGRRPTGVMANSSSSASGCA